MAPANTAESTHTTPFNQVTTDEKYMNKNYFILVTTNPNIAVSIGVPFKNQLPYFGSGYDNPNFFCWNSCSAQISRQKPRLVK